MSATHRTEDLPTTNDEAIEACRRAVALCPEWGGGHNALAYALTRRGYDYEIAYQAVRSASSRAS